MPYDILHRGDKWIVHKRGDSHVMGTHDTKENAVKQIQAVYANEEREKHE